MNILSIIPARGGSKGFKGKNIFPLYNKPLIAWSIEASLKSKYITKTIVSSDDDEILEISKNYGSQIIKRPDELALDYTPSEPVITHALKTLNENFDFIVFLQPTSPLRNSSDIDSAIKMYLDKKSKSLISVKEVDNKFLKSFLLNDNKLEPINNPKFPFTRRQDLPKLYMPNGAIYIVDYRYFLENEQLFSDDCVAFVMSDEKSIDIDSYEDIIKCEKVLTR
ncbi:CMP-N-acetylneuraminic acid synthetase [Campylobacter blaseri]|uniref:Acylneuraminate cytidylyltransferase n=1 Tax=Campylobacter blaseri TaxID=2042961 RepID=A0A2P8QZ85_9BACT|nr:acylneuraminate cytidylyltransferase family protein [Campylobacter blaseri]PSM51558.1 acylneuraminate cytidylyltransferase [Campylobacter blaseri]PSM53351.1 acylneuraminate cytidylyltransferase [Campylobacter blaseri]QKF86645.1 CMP-N-acetylneuraminic acid synthetase [Campylobacter blaseri]